MKSPRIDIIEHDPGACSNLVESLLQMGFSVKVASVLTVRSRAQTALPSDLIVLDLPNLNPSTLEFIASVQSACHGVIYVLAPPAHSSAVVRVLELGVDDIQLKPVHTPSLTLRIRNAISRLKKMPSIKPMCRSTITESSHGWQLNEDERTAVPPNGKEMELTKGEFVILSALVQAEGRIVVRDRLVGQLGRSMLSSSPESLTTLIYRLRKKLDCTEAPYAIRTIPGDGYRIVHRN